MVKSRIYKLFGRFDKRGQMWTQRRSETHGLPPLRGRREARRWDDWFNVLSGKRRNIKYLSLAAYTVLSLTE